MLKVLVASPKGDGLEEFCTALGRGGEVVVDRVSSGGEALAKAETDAPHLVVIDKGLGDIDALALVSKLLHVNAMINTAVVSKLSDEDFHEAGEGLGIMSRLSADADAKQAAEVLDKLKSLTGL